MSARSGEGVVAVVIALFLFGGVALDSWGPDVGGVVQARAEPEFSARAVFCPPSLGKPASRVSLTAATGGDEPIAVGVEPGSEEREELAPGSILEHKPPTAGASDVVGYGGSIEATAVTSIEDPVGGVGAAGCARRASTRWYFPEGNSTVTHDQRMLIYNPFPDEAVVSVSLLTPAGERSKAGLSDVAVPSESSFTVEINKFVSEQQKVLGTVVSAVRGRIVAWRLSIAEPEEKPSGVQFTLGATATSDVWHFPEGAVGEGIDERLIVMNPGSQEALVDVSLATAERTEQVAALTGMAVPPRSTISIPIDQSMLPGGEAAGVSAVIRSVNAVPVVAERTVFYATEELDGVASEIGATVPVKRWLLGPATSRPDTDSAVLLNPGPMDVQVTLEIMRADGRTLRPRALRNVPLSRGARLRVPLSDLTAGAPTAVLVTATGPVVAERFSYSGGAGDVASLMGLPLPD
ncbi:MAG TPA: DUF5719 family protein [Actinomycetota bacterium]|nr:DUF5719 family protein [Actinomycetota bacterium]